MGQKTSKLLNFCPFGAKNEQPVDKKQQETPSNQHFCIFGAKNEQAIFLSIDKLCIDMLVLLMIVKIFLGQKTSRMGRGEQKPARFLPFWGKKRATG